MDSNSLTRVEIAHKARTGRFRILASCALVADTFSSLLRPDAE